MAVAFYRRINRWDCVGAVMAKDRHWKLYVADFNAMTDEDIENECETSRQLIDEHQDWLDAVASWEAAGKPRGTT